MEQKDYWTDTLRRKEKADEDRYFAEQDRRLIEKLHRQHQPDQETEPSETATGVLVDTARWSRMQLNRRKRRRGGRLSSQGRKSRQFAMKTITRILGEMQSTESKIAPVIDLKKLTAWENTPDGYPNTHVATPL